MTTGDTAPTARDRHENVLPATDAPPSSTKQPLLTGLWTNKTFWLVVTLTAVIAAISQAIGAVVINVGHSQINLLPIIWAVLIGTAVSVQPWRRVPAPAQHLSSVLIAPVIAVFMARLGLLIGPSLSTLGGSSAALLLQEIGHILGSVIFCLPISIVLLGMGRTSIGATYSIDREPMLGIIAERCGGDSPEYKGALGTYVVGSVFGAVIVAVIASVLGSLHVFSPISLGIGTAVGSTSMMLGGLGALTAMFPGQKADITAYTGAASAITSLTGTYAAAFIALPLARKLYPMWVRLAARLGRSGTAVEPLPATYQGTVTSGGNAETSKVSLRGTAIALGVFGVVMIVIQIINAHKLTIQMVGGLILLLVISFVSILVARYVRWLPYIVVTMLISTLISAPFSPVAHSLASLLKDIDLVALGTPVLAIVGLSLGREAKLLATSGWKMVVTAVLVIAASFIAASAIAEVTTTFLSL
jgi:hypothetical protein